MLPLHQRPIYKHPYTATLTIPIGQPINLAPLQPFPRGVYIKLISLYSANHLHMVGYMRLSLTRAEGRLAPVNGFEPLNTESESVVLPIRLNRYIGAG